jgi:hypothetical protein
MKTFAIVDNKVVFNIIVADSVDTAQDLYPGKECIEYSSTQEKRPVIGLSYVDGVFEQPAAEYSPPVEESSSESSSEESETPPTE